MIRITDLQKSYGPLRVLNGVSLEVAPGEVCALIGPSGGGKSTLLRTINGLETFDSGRIEVDDIALGPEPGAARDVALQKIRRRVGMVFQQFNLFPHRSVLENVMEAPVFVLGRRVVDVQSEALELLDRVGLKDKADVRPANLSGGQQQRVAIARALAMRPEAILFDEPTSALDPAMAKEVMAVMSDLAKSGQTMIVVTHHMELVRRVAHRVHVLQSGVVRRSGAIDELHDELHD